jgi:hypothetical protein
MGTADFMAYVGDFPAGAVQYGGSKGFCEKLRPLTPLSDAELFKIVIKAEMVAGNSPVDYDTRPDSKIMSTEIDFDYAGRTWTYQYCTEFGFYQTVSKLHRVRPFQVDVKYWRD